VVADKIGGKAIKPNPALKPFEFLVGEWKTTGRHPFFPDADLKGRAVFEWISGGAFLQMHGEIDHPKFPDGITIFGSDDGAGKYYMIYFDERGVSRKYDVSIKDGQLKWWRNNPKLSQRFTLTVEKNKLVSRGEMSQDGGAWEDDLSLTYTRL
jgi:hypothetical protein